MKPTVLFSTKWLHLLQRGRWTFASRRLPDAPSAIDAVNIIAWHIGEAGQTRLVVIEEFRVSIDRWEFALPAGLVDANEELGATAARELVEETGLTATAVRSISGPLYSSAGLTDESTAIVTVSCQGPVSDRPGVEGEQIRVHLLDRAGCERLLRQHAEGAAAMSVKLWPVLASVAATGGFCGQSLD